MTRQAKEQKDINILMESWRETLQEFESNAGLSLKTAGPVRPTESIEVVYEKAKQRVTSRTFAFSEREIKKMVLAYGVGHGMDESQFKALFNTEIGKDILYLGQRRDRHAGMDPKEYYCSVQSYATEQEIFREVLSTKNTMSTVSLTKTQKFLDELPQDQLSGQQRNAIRFITTTQDQYCAVQGLAGTGKTHMLNYARQVFEANGFEVKGMSYTGKAASGLQKDAQISSTTLHSFLNQLEREAGNAEMELDFKTKTNWNFSGLKPANGKEVWIVDEASMVDNMVMRNLMAAADIKQAKVVLVGDNQQLLPVGAGNAFSNLVETGKINYATLDEIRRQKEERLLRGVNEAVLGDVKKSFEILAKDIQSIENKKNRLKTIANEFTRLAKAERAETVILTAGNADRKQLNQEVRKQLKKRGELTEGLTFKVQDSNGNTLKREFAVDDKVIFLQNDNQLDVKNGQTGWVKAVKENSLVIESDQKTYLIDLNEYNKIDHGYAITSYKAQGITENRAIINLDSEQKQLNSRNGYYVDISRARYEVKIFTDAQVKIQEQVKEFATKLTSDDFKKMDPATPAQSPKKGDFKQFWQATFDKMAASLEQVKADLKIQDMSAMKDISNQMENPAAEVKSPQTKTKTIERGMEM